MPNQIIQKVTSKFEQYSEPTLTYMLLVAGIVIILIALFVKNPYIKALVAAYVFLP